MSRFSASQILPKTLHALYKGELDHVRASPKFGAAIRLFTNRNRSIALNAYDPAFGKYIGDISNVLLESAALYFHILKTHRNTGFGATLSQLQLIGFVHDFASPRRVSMYVQRMIQVGRISYGVAAKDKRVRRLIPGEPIFATATKHAGDVLAAADLIWPGNDLETRVKNDRDFFERMYLEIGRHYLGGADPLRPFSDIRYFTSKDSGTFLLNSLAYERLNALDRLKPDIRIPLNYSELVQHCGTTRTHLRNIVEGAAERQLLSIGDDRSVSLTDKFIDVFERYVACVMILMHRSAVGALHDETRGANTNRDDTDARQ